MAAQLANKRLSSLSYKDFLEQMPGEQPYGSVSVSRLTKWEYIWDRDMSEDRRWKDRRRGVKRFSV